MSDRLHFTDTFLMDQLRKSLCVHDDCTMLMTNLVIKNVQEGIGCQITAKIKVLPARYENMLMIRPWIDIKLDLVFTK